MTQRQMSGGGRLRRQKTYAFGRVCEAKGCTTRLSIYNDDSICAHCFEAIPLVDLPTTVGRFL